MNYLSLFVLFSLSPLFLTSFFMESLRIGSININGGRDCRKRACLNEYIQNKNIDITFVQETHSDVKIEVDWKMGWRSDLYMSHGSNVSGGVAILFSKTIDITNVSVNEIERGRILAVQTSINGLVFVFINIYASNNGAERIHGFKKLFNYLKQSCDENTWLILGGDWNCTENFTLDRNGEEPHPSSAKCLQDVISNSNLVDVWRQQHPTVKQYTWVKVSHDHISTARLDRFYVSTSKSNRILKSTICPNGFSDHHLCLIDINVKKSQSHSYYWHFNVKLLQDVLFCEKFNVFWMEWKKQKSNYEDIVQWWDIGKAQIRIFCQNYIYSTNGRIKKTVSELEKEIKQIESELIVGDVEIVGKLEEKKRVLASLFHEKAKGALIRARFAFVREMDAPSSFFFNLEKKEREKKMMLHLKDLNGNVISDPKEMRKIALDFYKDLFAEGQCDKGCSEELHKDLLTLSDEQSKQLDSGLQLKELSEAVQKLSTGKTPGIDGLPSEFYKHFWNQLKDDFYEVFNYCYQKHELPTSCKRAVLSLLPKKGDLGMLKNWRPVAVLCTDYKILAKCLANRLKPFLEYMVNEYQTYCIPNRTIMDNLFLVRDIIDITNLNSENVGIFAIDQEKAFDRVSHFYLFKTLEAFGVGQSFISWIQMLYKDASVMLKVGGGLSRPVAVLRGIRQGCPLSGMLYSLAIEPLLCKLRKTLQGITVEKPIKLVAYADDVTIFIKNERDVSVLMETLKIYENASTARVNWEKCEGFFCGQSKNPPVLPGGVKWSKDGFKCLGVYLGTETFKTKNWEGMVAKMCSRLSKWSWVLPQLSYRGRVLVTNNLAASALWHKMNVLDPPDDIIQELQKRLVDFFWTGQHWTKAAVLFLPVNEGGQGLIDIKSRIKTFRLQAAQKLLYSKRCWTDTAKALLHKVDVFKYDLQLFLMNLTEMDLKDTSAFYKTMLKTWTSNFQVERNWSDSEFRIEEEPLFHNPLFQARVLNSKSLQKTMARAGCTRIKDLKHHDGWKSAEEMSDLTGIKSVRFMKQVMDAFFSSLPYAYHRNPGEGILNEEEEEENFPDLPVSARVEEEPQEESILTFKTPEIHGFKEASKKSLYLNCVKVAHQSVLKNCRETKWTEVLGPDSSPRRCWRSLYKSPIEKRTADLQWRIIHWAVATNRHVAHIDPTVEKKCPFCDLEESTDHLFLYCSRLRGVFQTLKTWIEELGEEFNDTVFIYGLKYKVSGKKRIGIINFLIAETKMAIWVTRKRMIKDDVLVDPERMLRGFVTSRIRAEFVFFKLTKNLVVFMETWGLSEVLCSIDNEEDLILNC